MNKFFSASKKILNKDAELEKAQNELKISIALGAAFLLLLVIIAFLMYRSNKALKDLDKQTKMLNDEIALHIETHKNLEHQLAQKNKLIGLISHDLINPLGASESLLAISIDLAEGQEELLEILTTCKKSISENKRMLNDTMNWIKKTNKSYESNPQIVHIYDAIDAVHQILETQINQKKLKFKNNVSLKSKAYIDPEQLQVVFRNIIQNAIKFTDIEGSIVVDSYTEQDFIFVSVKDDGIGMTEEMVKQVFDTQRLTQSFQPDGVKGHGFGMIISKEFIALNKGDIFVDSTLNKGTTFTIKLPANKNE